MAVAGNDCKIRIYGDIDKDRNAMVELKDNGSHFPGHTKRIFALRFHNND